MLKKAVTIGAIMCIVLSTGKWSFADSIEQNTLSAKDKNQIKQSLRSVGTKEQYIDNLVETVVNNEIPDCLNVDKQKERKLIETNNTDQKIEYVYEYADGSISREGIDYSDSIFIQLDENGTVQARGTIVNPSPSSSSAYHTQYIGATAYADTPFTMAQMKIDYTMIKPGAGYSSIERAYDAKSTGKIVYTTSITKNPYIARKTATSTYPAAALFDYKVNNTTVKCVFAFNVQGASVKAAANEYQ